MCCAASPQGQHELVGNISYAEFSRDGEGASGARHSNEPFEGDKSTGDESGFHGRFGAERGKLDSAERRPNRSSGDEQSGGR
jgi:hypothetical protein